MNKAIIITSVLATILLGTACGLNVYSGDKLLAYVFGAATLGSALNGFAWFGVIRGERRDEREESGNY